MLLDAQPDYGQLDPLLVTGNPLPALLFGQLDASVAAAFVAYKLHLLDSNADVEGTPVAVLAGMLLLFVVFVAIVLLIPLGPFGVELRHIRLDGSGLWLGRKFLSAEEIGECAVVSEGEASWAGFIARCRAVKLGYTQVSYNFFASKGPAVLVVQDRAGLRRPGWLIATKDPQGLVAALSRLHGEAKEGRA